MPDQNYRVTFSAVDQISRPLGNIGRELTQLSKSVGGFEKEASSRTRGGSFFERAAEFGARGSREIGRGIREVGRAATETGHKLKEAFEPLAELAGIGGVIAGGFGLAAAAKGIVAFAEAGKSLGQRANLIGDSAQTIHELGNAATLGGSSFETMGDGLQYFQKRLSDATNGIDGEAIGTFRKLGIEFENLDGSARLASKVLPELFDKIKETKNPIAAGDLLKFALGPGSESMITMAKGGAEELQKLREEGKSLDPFSPAAQQAAKDFASAMEKVKVATAGFGTALGEKLAPIFTPMVNKFADWLGDLQKIPAAMEAIKYMAIGLGAVLAGDLVLALVKLQALLLGMKGAAAAAAAATGASAAAGGGAAAAAAAPATYGTGLGSIIAGAIGPGLAAASIYQLYKHPGFDPLRPEGSWQQRNAERRLRSEMGLPKPESTAPATWADRVAEARRRGEEKRALEGGRTIPPPAMPPSVPNVPLLQPGARTPLESGRDFALPPSLPTGSLSSGLPLPAAPASGLTAPALASPSLAPQIPPPPAVVPPAPAAPDAPAQKGWFDWMKPSPAPEFTAPLPPLDGRQSAVPDGATMASWQLGGAPDANIDMLKSADRDTRHSIDIDIAGATQARAVRPLQVQGEGPSQNPLRTQFAFATV